ncbi:hypothetical protein X735_12535 [Mesorhizobium sp. L2C085B000]|uniref:site-specific integrase n=1 Tax=Mesorhizobium sp. L2C085B000 TaxID=1287117 RepID=UPI0003D02D1C|nr:site-specific integrase [Mesorhizobium sp. L2C085B000]ESZ17790.1 hypothetical protein X735_12535 [Mesorhizobium sp. L2C085B000]
MSNQKVRITKTVVADAAKTGKEYVIWDSRVAGFGLRVRPSGAKSFVFVYRSAGGRAGSVKRMTIKASNPDVAYDRAKELAGQFHAGIDPATEKADGRAEAERKKKISSVGDVLDSFITDHAKESLKDKTASEYERIVEKILKPKLGHIKIDALEPKNVAEMYRDLRGTPTQAAAAVRVLSSALSWAEDFDLRPAGPNPASIRLKGSRRRQRLFSDAEVARLLNAITALAADEKITKPQALALRLLFATGCRAGEICGLRWLGVDFDEGLLRWPDTKTGFLEKPLTDDAWKLLKKAERIVGVDFVCPSPGFKQMRVEFLEDGFERVMKSAKVTADENATLHLIRHWFATKTYTDKSIPLPVAMAIVGHTSVATAMRYAHVARDELKNAAKDAAKRRATAIKAAEKKGRVVQLKGGAK